MTGDDDVGRRLRRLTVLADEDPARARAGVEHLYDELRGAPDHGHRAPTAYLLSRLCVETGEPALAGPLLDEATASWTAQGEHLLALRSYAGRMHLLAAEGRHVDAVRVGERALSRLDALSGADPRALAEVAAILQQNLGAALAASGSFDAALLATARAESCYRRAGRADRVPFVIANRAAELLDLGRVTDAVPVLRAARDAAAAARIATVIARCDSMLGWVDVLRGDADAGLRRLAAAEERFRDLALVADADLAALRRGDGHLLLDDRDGARATFGPLVERASTRPQTRAFAQVGLAAAAIGDGDPTTADGALLEAVRGFEELGHVPGLVTALLERAGLLLKAGRRDEAVAVALDADERLGTDAETPLPLQRLYADLRLIDVLLPDHEAAVPYAERGMALADRLRIPLLACRARRRLAAVRLAQGALADAEHLLRRTIDDGEHLRRRLPREGLRRSFGDDVDQARVALTQVLLDRGTEAAVTEAAEVADARRDQVLAELVAGTVVPEEAAADPRTRELVTAIDIASDAIFTDADDPRTVALRSHVARLMQELTSADRAGVTSPAAPSVAGDTVTIAYTELAGEIAVFVTRRDRVRGVRHLTTTAVLRDLLEELDGHLWRTAVAGAAGASEGVGSAGALDAVLLRLGELLLDPIAHLVPSRPRDLVVVPHGAVHDVPMAALPLEGRPLVERAPVTVAPGLAFTAPGRALDREAMVLSVGLPTARTPAVVDEAGAFAAAGFDVRALVGSDATTVRLRHEAPCAAVMHLACHGRFEPEDPASSRLHLADGWLTARELAHLDVAPLVVTSACESGRHAVHTPGSQTRGLARAFLAAGADTVVASRWPIDDRTAASTVAAFARHLRAGAGPSAALRTAQLELRRQHPNAAHWAALVAFGRPDHHPAPPEGSDHAPPTPHHHPHEDTTSEHRHRAAGHRVRGRRHGGSRRR